MASGERTIKIKFDGSAASLIAASEAAAADLDAFNKKQQSSADKATADAEKAADAAAKREAAALDKQLKAKASQLQKAADEEAAKEKKRLDDKLKATADDYDNMVKKVKNTFSNIGTFLGNLATSGARTLSMIGGLGLGIQALGPPIVAMGHAAVTASGALLLIPAAIGAGIAAMLTFKLGAAGIKQAFAGLTPTLNSLKASVSATFEKGLQPAVANLKTLLPQLKPGFDGIATSVSGVATSFTAMLKSSLTTRDLNTILTGTSTIVKNLGAGLAPIGNAFIRIAATAMPELTKLTGGFKGLADKFDAFITKAAGDGRLKTWIDNGITEIKKIGTSFTTIAQIAKGIFDGLGGGFGDLLSATKPVLTVVKEFVTSLPGQALLKSIGELLSTMATAAESLLTAMSPLIQPILDIANAVAAQLQPVFDALKPTFKDIADSLGPALVGVIKDLGPVIPPLAAAFGKVVDALAKGLSPALGGIVPLIKILAAVFIAATPAILALSIPFILVTDAAVAFMQLITGDLQGALTTMKSGFQYASDTSATIVHTNWGQMEKDVMDGNSQISANIWAQVQPWKDGMSASAGGAWSALNDKSSQFASIIGLGTTAVQQKLASQFQPWNNATSGSAQGILGAFGNTPGSMEGIGESIVDGLVNGIRKKVGAAMTAASNLASGLLNIVNKVLNVNSPSKAFRDGPGVAIPEGLAAGIDLHTPHATGAVKRMTSAVMAASASLPDVTAAYQSAGGAVSYAAAANAAQGSSAPVFQVQVMLDGTDITDKMQAQVTTALTGVARGLTTGAGTRR